MKYLIAISGPVASGKSALAQEFIARFKAHRISTRQLLFDAGAADERQALIDTGKRLDAETEGTWVRDGIARYVQQHEATHDVIIVDSVRIAAQVRHLRQEYGSKFVHIHVSVPYEVAKERYDKRAGSSDQAVPYDVVRSDPTESQVWGLDRIADRIVENVNCEPPSLLALAVAGLGLHPRTAEQCVDVIVSGQYGSEGKGHICAHLAGGYDVLMRVGGPNAGHNVAYPKYNYRQLPSGTQSNTDAKLLIAAGSTIRPTIMLREIAQCGAAGRVVIDEQALVIEDWDVEFESSEGGLGTIGSTKQGAGSALARKILNRGEKPLLGGPVRLAKHHPDLLPFVGSVGRELEDAYSSGAKIMLEGTQGTDLSLLHGSYPHVTARETTASGCIADAGVASSRVRKVVMVVRRYPIRVGGESGPMDIPIDFKIVSERSGVPYEEILRTEVGSVSGNQRRVAEFDWEQLRRSAVLNGATDIALSFSDYISIENRKADRFDELTDETREFIALVEKVANAPVSLVSTRFERGGVIDRRNWR
ncbi:adenylosuccinate synthase [Tardiphaga alba]|uniref:Adenylosuccinate synthetase n=1 Tax=Tardiphaga alba TaxID=340268 RepID=A0ABX8A371_9BRAD|nr:adenylosuccinate synthetase [Tardiphaga alba]QUS38019.1 adenylosuccinate synthase [Tardiphaga alba]